jgi:hypothetical protein
MGRAILVGREIMDELNKPLMDALKGDLEEVLPYAESIVQDISSTIGRLRKGNVIGIDGSSANEMCLRCHLISLINNIKDMSKRSESYFVGLNMAIKSEISTNGHTLEPVVIDGKQTKASRVVYKLDVEAAEKKLGKKLTDEDKHVLEKVRYEPKKTRKTRKIATDPAFEQVKGRPTRTPPEPEPEEKPKSKKKKEKEESKPVKVRSKRVKGKLKMDIEEVEDAKGKEKRKRAGNAKPEKKVDPKTRAKIGKGKRRSPAKEKEGKGKRTSKEANLSGRGSGGKRGQLQAGKYEHVRRDRGGRPERRLTDWEE